MHAVAKDLPGTPFGKHLHSVYRVCMMSGDATETHEYRETFTKAGHRSTTALELRNREVVAQAFPIFRVLKCDCPSFHRLAALVKCLETAAARHPDDPVIRQHLSSCGKKLRRLDSFIDDPEGFNGESAPRGGGTPSKSRFGSSQRLTWKGNELPGVLSTRVEEVTSPTAKLTAKLDMFTLKEQLQEQMKRQQQQNSPSAAAASRSSPFDALRREILSHLHSEIFKDRRMSTPPTQLPFAEVKYFDAASSVR